MAFKQDGYIVTRNVCPRNCYDACGMLSYTKNGRLIKVSGDPAHGYTDGKLCSKGYSYIRRVYSPERLRYPMRQLGRGTGRWERLSWDQAMDSISDTILEIKSKYGSTLPLCLNKYSGNFGILHYAVEGMFNSLGPTTQAIGSPCWSAGLDAHQYDMGDNRVSDPAELANAQTIVLWGANPAWTAIHSLPFIYKARERGATIIVIDPLFTETAKKADYYIQIKPGGDGALAVALSKKLRKKGYIDQKFLFEHTQGWEEYSSYLDSENLQALLDGCGLEEGAVDWLAEKIGRDGKPVYYWVGFGLQRHSNGGQNVRAINALGAITGVIGQSGGGVHYAQQQTWGFNFNFLTGSQGSRYISINRFAEELEALQDPPVKLLWIACRNLIAQDANRSRLMKQLDKLECIITVEHFMTATACCSDIVLPATTQFEELDVVPSYWHHWIALNEPAIQPFFDAKSDLEIAQRLTAALNKKSPGSSSFASDKTPQQLLDEEFNSSFYDLLQIAHWSELLQGPKRAKLPAVAWSGGRFKTRSGKFEFVSEKAFANKKPALAECRAGAEPCEQYPLWFITSHAQHSLNSQFEVPDWLARSSSEPVLLIHPETARAKHIRSGAIVKVYNQYGSIRLKAIISADMSADTVVCYQGTQSVRLFLNQLNPGMPADMGEVSTGARGMAFYDVFVNIAPVI